jgi:hypothetical protein
MRDSIHFLQAEAERRLRLVGTGSRSRGGVSNHIDIPSSTLSELSEPPSSITAAMTVESQSRKRPQAPTTRSTVQTTPLRTSSEEATWLVEVN